MHHTGALNGADVIASWHVDGKGWKGIGYHFVIEDGEIYQTQPVTAVSNHKWGHNGTRIGVAVVGNFDLEEMSEKNLDAFAWLYALSAELMQLRWPSNMVGPWPNRGPVVAGHCELRLAPGQDKTCPGTMVDMNRVRDLCRIARNKMRAGAAPVKTGVVLPFRRKI